MDIIQHKIVIVGGGFSGIGMAIKLRKNGESDFVLLEKSSQMGGTWRDNTYPGCACDIPSISYSYSFAQSSEWSRLFPESPELLEYTNEVVEKFDVMDNVELDSELLDAQWDNDKQRWIIRTNHKTYESQYIINCQGPLHEPYIPDFPGLESFQGHSFHSARWDHSYDLTNKRIAVIGTGSSAIQFVPKIQPKTEKVTVFQRTAPWVLPKIDFKIPKFVTLAFRTIPGLQRIVRAIMYVFSELLQWAERRPSRMKPLQFIANQHRLWQVKDPELRQKTLPSFVLGCKRILLSNTWYPAISAPNVDVVHAGVTKFTADGVIDEQGQSHPVDVAIFGTGFQIGNPSFPTRVFGRLGKSLAETWNGTPQAYMGTTVHGFPNMFMILGPNMGNGHGSAFVIIESQIRYIANAIKKAKQKDVISYEVQASIQESWNQKVQKALKHTVWVAGGCNSWYKNNEGVNFSIYPWSTIDMQWRLRRFDTTAYQVKYATRKRIKTPPKIDLAEAVVAVTGGARGIGLATAEAFVALGAKVAIGDIDELEVQRAVKKLGNNAIACKLNVVNRQSVEAFAQTTEDAFGPIDVWVNNAGIMPTGDYLTEPDEMDAAVMSINHWGTSLGMKIMLPKMIARGKGHVINVASMGGKIAIPHMSTYIASKFATVGLSECVRGEIYGTGVTITTLLPTAVNTRLSENLPLHGLFTQDPPAIAAAIVKSCRTRAPEIAVPGGLLIFAKFYHLLPIQLWQWVTRILHPQRLLDAQVRQARAQYETEIVTLAGETSQQSIRNVGT